MLKEPECGFTESCCATYVRNIGVQGGQLLFNQSTGNCDDHCSNPELGMEFCPKLLKNNTKTDRAEAIILIVLKVWYVIKSSSKILIMCWVGEFKQCVLKSNRNVYSHLFTRIGVNKSDFFCVQKQSFSAIAIQVIADNRHVESVWMRSMYP